MYVVSILVVFFKQKTAYEMRISDWSSDVFSSDLEALKTIARVKPKVLVINGGDGTVQAALTELYHGGHFGPCVPPVAVLPNGKTNLIALDLGATGDPLDALARVLEIARDGVSSHVVARELIAVSDGRANTRPVLGIFLGGDRKSVGEGERWAVR